MPPLPPLETNPTQPAPVTAPAETVAPSVSPLPPAPSATPAGLKEVSLTYAAVTHWLTAAFAIPLIGGIIFVVLLLPFLGRAFPEGSLSLLLILSAVGLGLTWAGVWYSARFVNRSYRVEDPEALAKRATLVTVVIGVVYRLYSLVGASFQAVAVSAIGFVATLAVFYFASLRYLKKNV